MSARRWLFAIPALAVLAAAPLAPRPALAQAPDAGGPSRAAFMRQKLEISKQILEGLTMENFETVAGNAKKLKVISEAAQLAEPSSHNTRQYEAYLTVFRSNVDNLSAQARARQLEGASFAFMKLSINCVECHRYVRDQQGNRAGKP